MKVEIRYCKKCTRRTIQGEDVFLDTSWSPTKIIPVYYCPNCGTQWKVEKKMVDVDINE